MGHILSAGPNRRIAGLVRALLGAIVVTTSALPVSSGYLHAQQLAQSPAPSADALFRDAARFLEEGRYPEAIQGFRKFWQMEPSNILGLRGVAEGMIRQGQMDEALQMVRAEAEKYPARADIRNLLANTAVRAGRFDESIAAFEALLAQADPQSAEAGKLHLQIGETYRRKGDLEAAITNLREAVKLLPENALARTTLAMALDSAGKRSEAESAYRSAIERDPENAIALNNLAYLLCENHGDLDEALDLAQRAHALLPNLTEVSDTLGWIDLKMARTEDAILAYRNLVQKEPAQPEHRYHLAMAFQQKGDRTAASEQLHAALELHPPADLETKIRRLLEALGN
ncbi:MAG TPA: tetratricopeptide repeat protein [Bryobacteraceae bacterium]|nr:tetratricopeptide repeat protein [Bryobacteraceae bacterium]